METETEIYSHPDGLLMSTSAVNTDVPIETNKSSFIQSVVKVSGSDGGLDTKMIDGVKHFKVEGHIAHNFDCTTGWNFVLKYDTSIRAIMRYVAVTESIVYEPDFLVNYKTPYDIYRGKKTIGSYVMKITAWVPITFKTTCFFQSYTSPASEGEPFYRDKLTKMTLGNLRVSDSVLVGYEGILTTNMVGASLNPGQPSGEPILESNISMIPSAQRLVETNYEGVYELRR